MSDLTKLTAKEFSRRINNCDWDMEERIENECRLERLEYLEGLYFEVEGIREDGTLGPIGEKLLERMENQEAQCRDYEAELERHATDRTNQRKRLKKSETFIRGLLT